jgi:hypothetical protein
MMKHLAMVAAAAMAVVLIAPAHAEPVAVVETAMNAASPTAAINEIRNADYPEPATMMLVGTCLLAAFRARRRQA